MSTKQILSTLGILLALAAVFGFWASFTRPIAAPVVETRVLAGIKTPAGGYLYTEEKDYYSIKAAYPAQTGLAPAADAKARVIIEQGLADEITGFKEDSGLDTLSVQDAQMQNISDEHKYALDLEYKAYSSTSTVSYAYQVYADTLGAHPNTYYMTFAFDRDGNILKLEDLFVASSTAYLQKISDAATKQVTAQLRAGLGQADLTGAIFKEGLTPVPENFQNFCLDGDDLLILIPPYQVAPYVAGSFEVRVPLAQFEGLIRPEVQ